MLPAHACDPKRIQRPAPLPSMLSRNVFVGIPPRPSCRNLEEMMAERGVVVDHSTLYRWVIHLVPLRDRAFRRHKRHVERRWRIDETCIKIRGQWKYLHWAVDTENQIIDNSGVNMAALATLKAGKPEGESITIRQSNYLNNLVEQDHRNIKHRICLMQGFKLFCRVQTIMAGIELIHMIRKRQYQHPAGDGSSPSKQFYLLAA